MDNPQLRPRLSSYASTFATTATATPNVHAYADIPMEKSTPWAHTKPTFTAVDFAASAKIFRRSQLRRRIVRISIIVSVLVVLIVAALGAVGYALNAKYAGRALPYSYIGDMSIGGLTQAEIKALLDERSKTITVTLIEGGLVKEVPITAFDPTFDTQKASEQAITGFNPFAYLTKHTFSVPVEVNERYVDGFIRLHVADTQIKAQNASIVKGKKGLVINPETTGNRTSTAYVVEQLRKQLPTMADPTIKLTAASDTPSITQADLQDDIDLAKRLIATKVGVRIYSTTVRPTEDQKLSWLEISEVPGANEVQIKFSQSKIREYVMELAKKYTVAPVDDMLITNPDGSQAVQAGKAGVAITNADEVASKLYTSLQQGFNDVIAFTSQEVEYKKLAAISEPEATPTNQTQPSNQTTLQTEN